MKRLAFVILLCGVWRLSAQDAPPMEKVETLAERAERIIADAADVSKNLEQREPNAATLAKQKQILKDLEELLKQPPPPPMKSSSSSSSSNSPSKSKSSSDSSKSNSPMPMPMPMGGNSGSPMPMGGNSGAPMPMPMPMGGGEKESPAPMSRREKRLQEQQQQGKAGPKMGMGQPMPMQGEPMTKQGGDPKKGEPPMGGGDMAKGNPMGMGPMTNQPMGLGNDPKTPPVDQANRLADLSKGVWGHLPETMRQELDLYYRDRFMPRYSDLLREYYSSIADGERRR